MSFWKTLAAVVIGNILTLALVAGLGLALFAPGIRAIETALGVRLPTLDITFGDDLPITRPQVVTNIVKPAYTPPTNQNRTPRISSTEPKRDASAIRSSAQMCKFWNKAYAEDQTTKSKKFREQACSRYEQLSGKSRTTIISPVYVSRPDNEKTIALADRRAEVAREKREAEALERQCERMSKRFDYIQSRLRAGYTVSEGNRLRDEKRELSRDYAWSCLREQ